MAANVVEPFANFSAQQLLKNGPSLYGWVRKEEPGTVKGMLQKAFDWPRRFMILCTGCLYLYKDSRDSNFCEMFTLTNYRVCIAQDVTKYTWTFKLIHESTKTLFFAVDSEVDLKNWTDLITKEKDEYCNVLPGKEGYCEIAEVAPRQEAPQEVPQRARPASQIRRSIVDRPQQPLPPNETLKPKAARPLPPEPGAGPAYRQPLPPEPSPGHGYRQSLPPEPSTGPGYRKPLPPKPSLEPGYRQALPPEPSGGFGYRQPLPPEPSPKSGHRQPGPTLPPRTEREGRLPLSRQSVHVTKQEMAQSLPRPQGEGGRSAAARPAAPRTLNRKTSDSGLSRLSNDGYEDVLQDLNKALARPPVSEPGYTPQTGYSRGPAALPRKPRTRSDPEGRESFRPRPPEVSQYRDPLPPSANHEALNREAASSLLRGEPPGTYLLRWNREVSDKSLSVRDVNVDGKPTVRHYKIFSKEGRGYALDPNGQHCLSIVQLLEHFYANKLPNTSMKLCYPYEG